MNAKCNSKLKTALEVSLLLKLPILFKVFTVVKVFVSGYGLCLGSRDHEVS